MHPTLHLPGMLQDREKKHTLPYKVFSRESCNHSPQECEASCAVAGYQVWGSQFLGQCFCGSNEFAMDGVAWGCEYYSDNVVSYKFCAYALDTLAPGCIGSGVSSSIHVWVVLRIRILQEHCP
eukprot:CCRYP_017183-RA/>CCRYP_017183-RA protein AED:0.06 eAED:0.21 QI:0/-1/0/1/-1/0/1/0/122